MLDNLQDLEIQLAQLQARLDSHQAVFKAEQERLGKEFPKLTQLKDEAKRLNDGWIPFDKYTNFSRKEDVIKWIAKKNIPSPEETIEKWRETKNRIIATKVGMTYVQWSILNNLTYAEYEDRMFWKKNHNSVYTDGGLHFFYAVLAAEENSLMVYLEGRTPAAKESVVYLAVPPDGNTYLVTDIRCEEKYDISSIRHGELKRL
jgi:hypothetical protein